MSIATYHKKTIRDIDVRGKRVLVRVDFNVPRDDAGNPTDLTRVNSTLPTLNYLLKRGAHVVLMSHLGRPKGERNLKYSLANLVPQLQRLLDTKVDFCDDCIGPKAEEMAAAVQPGEVLLLENLRFYREEEANDKGFAAKLAKLGEIYVNDAFGTVHRAHASISAIAEFLPAVSGLLLEKDLVMMSKILAAPYRPCVAIMGGSKVSDKIGVIRNLLPKVDRLLIGGAMANTFLYAMGHKMGASKLSDDYVELVRELLQNDVEKKIMLPEDLVVADSFDNNARSRNVGIDDVPEGWMALDMGEKTINTYSAIIRSAATVIWNGPMGVFEMPNFAKGTEAIAVACAKSQGSTIVGGGDSLAAIDQVGVSYMITHVSTGGGSTLEYLEGRRLPGVDVLLEAED
ncbi:MAG: phosphoglycerate kinase [Peptococcaceae bacterium]|nr:phosphoglycerate kinase [Peptococcaceae bacterium]